MTYFVIRHFDGDTDPISCDDRQEMQHRLSELENPEQYEVALFDASDSTDDGLPKLVNKRPATRILRPHRHEGVECAYCKQEIKSERAGESTPNGSMHRWCAVQHEHRNPEQW